MNDEQQPNEILEPESTDDIVESGEAETLSIEDELEPVDEQQEPISEEDDRDDQSADVDDSENDDSDQTLEDEEIEDQAEEIEEPVNTLDPHDFDIESALAAVASLHELARPVEEETEIIADEDEEEPIIEPFVRATPSQERDDNAMAPETVYETDFPIPPASVLYRGQLGSVIPALLLIAGGALLTFWIPSQPDGIKPAILAGLFIAGLGLALISYWLSSGRWSVGSLMVGSLFLFGGGTATYLVASDAIGLMKGYPLLLVAIGTAFVLTDLFAPNQRRLWLIGLILAVAGLAGFIVTNEILPATIVSTLSILWIPLVIIAVITIIAILFGRRRATDANSH